MELAITIGIGLILLLLGLWGIRRGVRAGLVTLIGTILAVELVDLWQEAWVAVLRGWGGEGPIPTYSWTVLIFLIVALVLGYGSGMLLAPQVARKQLTERIVGGLLGFLNGALIVSYLLRYTTTLLQNEILNEAIFRAIPSRFLYHWLPWFFLATIASLMGAILVRGVHTLLELRIAIMEARLMRRELTAPPHPTSPRPASPPPTSQIPSPKQRATPTTPASQDKKISDKINQRLRK